MDDRLFLHDNERLLLSMRPSLAGLLADLLRGLGESLVVCLVLFIPSVIAQSVNAFSVASWVYVLVALMVTAAVLYRRWKLWDHSLFRVTTERILMHRHHSLLFGSPFHTLKWNQYQESAMLSRNLFDVFFGSRPLRIRYGNPDSKDYLTFPSLRYAEDIKHFLDKVDSAVRKQQEATLKPFVAAPRGRRDVAEE